MIDPLTFWTFVGNHIAGIFTLLLVVLAIKFVAQVVVIVLRAVENYRASKAVTVEPLGGRERMRR